MEKSQHGLKGKSSNNPAGRGKQGIIKEAVGVYIQSSDILKLGGKKQIRKHFTALIEKLLKK